MKTLLVTMLTIFATTAALAGDGTLSVAPAVVMLRGTPGQSATQTLTIINSASQPYAFDLVAKDVVVRDGKRVLVDAGQLPGSIAATAVFTRRSVTVAPGQRLSVEVTVTLPPKPAGHAVIAFFQGTTKILHGNVMMTASLGTLLTFALSDDVSASLSQLTISPPTASANLAVAQQFVNDGSEPLFAKAMLAIINGAGALVARQALNPRRLLPGERADVRAEYGGDLAPGHYRALVTYDLQNQKSLTSAAEFDIR
jgi:hypothetical protein